MVHFHLIQLIVHVIYSQNSLCKIVFIIAQNNFYYTEQNSLMNDAPSTDQQQHWLQVMHFSLFFFLFFLNQVIHFQGKNEKKSF